MGNAQDAEDVTQEAFLSAYKAWDNFRGGSAVSTWLYRIAVNACLMRLRKEKRARTMTDRSNREFDVVDWTPDPTIGPEGQAVNAELRNEIARAIAELPPDLRAAVVLRDVEELSNTEAADALNISVASLKARLHRGRVALRTRLAAYASTPS